MSTPETKGQALQRRFVVFGAAVLQTSALLPKTAQGNHIRNQLIRSGTAVAANYAEARAAESRADFIHKLRVVLKELNETEAWLGIVAEARLISPEKTRPLIAENQELCRVIAASLKTAGGFERS